MCVVKFSPRGESETATEHCRYIVPTARKIYRTFDKMKTTYGNDAHTANTKANIWRTVQRNIKSKGDMMSPMTTEKTEGCGNQRDILSLQKGYMDVRFMFGTKSTNSSATFNLARSIKHFVIAGRKFDENFCILPLYGRDTQLASRKTCRTVKTLLMYTTDIVLRVTTLAGKCGFNRRARSRR
jgi:hypothetical protein